jgi:hypothetical protein
MPSATRHLPLPGPSRFLLFIFIGAALAVILAHALYIVPLQKKCRDAQAQLDEKQARLAKAPWPQHSGQLAEQLHLANELLHGNPQTKTTGLVATASTTLATANATFARRIARNFPDFPTPRLLITGVTRLDFMDILDRVTSQLGEYGVQLDTTAFHTGEDSSPPIYQLIYKLWTIQRLAQCAHENHLEILATPDGTARITALSPIAYTSSDSRNDIPYLLEFPVRIELNGTLENFLQFARQLQTDRRFLPLKQLSATTAPPDIPAEGGVATVQTATFNIVCSSFMLNE